MPTGLTLVGTSGDDILMGMNDDDSIMGLAGDDWITGGRGDDMIEGNAGFDSLRGGGGDDRISGGRSNDFVFGDNGNDVLHGDDGLTAAKGSDLSSDYLNGGKGNDILYQSDGNDTLTGGEGRDSFFFKWSDPMVALAAGTGRAFATITDFSAADDKLKFDVAGIRRDADGANFIGQEGTASSFFSGDAMESDGEAVMILTEQSFASGADAVLAAQNEAAGDMIVYFNSTVGVASLLVVDGPDAAHSIARFTNITSLAELKDAGFSSADFIFV